MNGLNTHFHHSTSTYFNSVSARELNWVYSLEKYDDSDRHKHMCWYIHMVSTGTQTQLYVTDSPTRQISETVNIKFYWFSHLEVWEVLIRAHTELHTPGIWLNSLPQTYTHKRELYTTWGRWCLCQWIPLMLRQPVTCVCRFTASRSWFECAVTGLSFIVKGQICFYH